MKSVYVLLLIVLLAATAWPQSSTSTVRGTVRDQSGAVVPSASVALTNIGTNIASRAATNELGFFTFAGVLPGPYRLVVEAAGMRRFEATLTVQVQEVAVVDPVLTVGEAATAIEVKDVTPVVTGDSPALSHVLERQRIEQLPINGRLVTSLLQTVPGMEGNRAYGLKDGSQEFVLDGSAMGNRKTGEFTKRPPGLDTIQEFNVESNSSSARFTRPTTIIMTTRGGTNQLHGSLFETHRNNAIGVARRRTDFYENAPHLIRNESGGLIGGPVWLPKIYDGHNRTFWLFSFEGMRRMAGGIKGYSLPTEAMRGGDFRGLVDAQGRQYNLYDPFATDTSTWQRQPLSYRGQANVIDPARMNTLAKYLLSITPLPTRTDVNPLIDANWWGPTPDSQRQWTVTSRFDHRFGEKDQFYARYTQGHDYSLTQVSQRGYNTFPALNKVSGASEKYSPNRSLAVSWVRTLSPTLFNEFMASGSRESRWSGTGDPGVSYADRLGLPNPTNSKGSPRLLDGGLPRYDFESVNLKDDRFEYYIIDNHTTKIIGRHELQTGAHFRYDKLDILPGQSDQGQHNWNTLATALYDPKSARTNPGALPFTGSNLANMFLGVMNYQAQLARGFFQMRGREYALYLQDNFKLTPRLTLNLGLRWEYWPLFREKNDLLTTFDPDKKTIVLGTDLDRMYAMRATFPSIVQRLQSLGAKFVSYQDAGLPQGLMEKSSNNWGPRLGFAWRGGEGKTAFVLRGGYRISYFPMTLEAWTKKMRKNAPLAATFVADLSNAARTPDGIRNYGMRSSPVIFSGVNSRDAISLADATTLVRGSASVSYWAKNQPDPRVQDWNLTLEKEVMPNTLARVSYVGNHGSHLEQFYQFNENTPDYIWYVTTGNKLPTGEYASVARRPFDQQVYGPVEEYRMSGWSNFQGAQLELRRRYSKGLAFHVFYNISNAMTAGGQNDDGESALIPALNQFLPGAVPTDVEQRNRFLNYARDVTIPKHRVRWNWLADLPFGRGKRIGGAAGRGLDRLIGGWQIAGMGGLRSNYFSLPDNIYPTGQPVELYGYKYPIQDCRGGACRPGYLWWNGYIPANLINSVDAKGNPNGVMGVPASYKPAAQPINPMPKNPSRSDPMFAYYDSNTVWVKLNDGTMQQTTYDTGLHPWRRQYLPGVRQWGLDASIFKNIPITERVNVRLTADFFNVLNHPGNPNDIAGSGILNTRDSGGDARELQLSLRLAW